MKEICGFLDSRGRFHKTKEETELAESKLRLEQVERQLDNFNVEIVQLVFEQHLYGRVDPGATFHIENYVLERIAERILRNSDMFIEIINRKKLLEKDLELAKAQVEAGKRHNTWYYKLKWW